MNLYCFLKLLQKPEIVLVEKPQIRNSVLDHDLPLDAEAEGETVPFLRIDPTIFQHLRMNHARTGDLEPALLSVHIEERVHFQSRFDEGEKRESKANLCLR